MKYNPRDPKKAKLYKEALAFIVERRQPETKQEREAAEYNAALFVDGDWSDFLLEREAVATAKQEPSEYPVMYVCLDDFEELEEDEKRRFDFARNMSSDEWRTLAGMMCDDLYDGDAWENAKNAALDDLMRYKAETESTN